jgi:ABC-type phosphate transport system substrate-binding protein
MGSVLSMPATGAIKSETKVSQFINFVLSSEGQKIVTNEGYVPVN